MLCTITTTHTPPTDLSYLLHKHLARVQTFDLSFGRAHVFYPEADPERCTAALLLDIDPLHVTQKRRTPASPDFLLQPYVNDRPYVASSFLNVAIAEIFATALSGRCQARPELAAMPLPLQARLAVLPCAGGEPVLRGLFEPLGYSVTAERHPLNARVREWGASEYFTVTLTGTLRLCDLLSHVYVLVPVLDDEKHYWIGDDEVAKLLRRGEEWLARHPERELIVRRYLKHQRSLTEAALAQIADGDNADRDATDAQGGDAEDTDELEQLLAHLGYQWSERPPESSGLYRRVYRHPEGRKAIFVGDLVDRGPRILDTYQLVRYMVDAGSALCVPGNHEAKLVRKLRGRDVVINHGLERTLAEIERLPPELRARVCHEMADFFDGLISHCVLDDGKLVVAHAGMKASLQGRASPQVREFALYGETTGETDAYGLPVRHNWAAEYRGPAFVVYGHTPVPEAEWLNRTINIDTGCVFGGKLTALRYPELMLVSVPAARIYTEPIQPFLAAADPRTPQQQADDLLDVGDVLGKHAIHTRLWPTIVIRDEQSAAALEAMSRFAVDPRWLIYLPPTMSPPDPGDAPDRLEDPAQVLGYYRRQGISHVICEEKHMGSRAIVIVCRDTATTQRRFGIVDGGLGLCYTRTGRPFFADQAMEDALLSHVQSALTDAGFWEAFETDWVCLDGELMPWSFKAQSLLRQQYAPVGAAGQAASTEALAALGQTAERGLAGEALSSRYRERATMVARYVESYQRYCWPVDSIQDLRLAPFHVLATEGAVHVDKTHRWHLDTIGRIVAASSGPCLQMTASRVLDLADAVAETAMLAWWEALTAQGGEGIVVKPLEFIARGRRGLVQPALKYRGRAYLRIIYGPEYTAPEHLERLRARHLGVKRALALREFALGIEALERFVRKEPLRRVHECVFGGLALESEAVDPRL